MSLLQRIESLSIKRGEETVVTTVTVTVPGNLRPALGHEVYATPYVNEPPEITSLPLTEATAGEAYSYNVQALDSDGIILGYVLIDRPDGMAIDADTGILTWAPTEESPAQVSVVLRVYDRRGGYDEQSFIIDVAGGNRAPDVAPLADEYVLTEGQPFSIGLFAQDPDFDALHYFADNLPPGATSTSSSNPHACLIYLYVLEIILRR